MSKPTKKARISNSKTLPSQYELASLAAILTGSCGVGFNNPGGLNSRIVEAALDLWHEAGRQLLSDPNLNFISRKRVEIIGQYSESILVGKHLLPAISDDFLLLEHCDFDDFLVMALGMSEKVDRVKWFRSFLDHWEETDVTQSIYSPKSLGSIESKRYPSFKDVSRQRAAAYVSDKVVRTINVNPYRVDEEGPKRENIECFKVDGIWEPLAMARAFRAWRLTMKDANAKAETPYDLETCIARAKAKNK